MSSSSPIATTRRPKSSKKSIFAIAVVVLMCIGYQFEYHYFDFVITNAAASASHSYEQPTTFTIPPRHKNKETNQVTSKTTATPRASTTTTTTTPKATSAAAATTTPASTTNTDTANTEDNPNLPSIIVQLRGELGNHLSVWSHAKGIQLMLQGKYNISSNLIIRHQMLDNDRTDNPKFKPTEKKIKQCFPNLRGYDHSAGNGHQYKVSKRIQDLWLYKSKDDNNSTTTTYSLKQLGNDLIRVNGIRLPLYEYITQDEITKGLDAFVKLLDISKNTTISSTSLRAASATSTTTGAAISIPHLVVFTLANNFMVDKYYEQIREYFAFDYDACCKERPYPDETVFVSTIYTQCFV